MTHSLLFTSLCTCDYVLSRRPQEWLNCLQEGDACLIVDKSGQIDFLKGCANLYSCQQLLRLPIFSQPYHHWKWPIFQILINLMGGKMIPIVLICIFLFTNKIDPVFCITFPWVFFWIEISVLFCFFCRVVALVIK